VVVITPRVDAAAASIWTDEGYADPGVTPAALWALKASGYTPVEIMRSSASNAEIDLLVPAGPAPATVATSSFTAPASRPATRP
jgi:hypothetical protein